MKCSRNLYIACHKNFSLFLVFMLVFASPAIQAVGVVYTATLTYDVTLFADADYNIVVEGVSNGTPFNLNNPLSGTVFDLSNLGDIVEVTASGSARSGPNGDASDAGHSRVNAALTIDVIEDELGPVFNDAAKAVIAILWDIDANGLDAFARSNASIIGPILPLESDSCLSDTLFGDSLNGVDLGTFGAPCSGATVHKADIGLPPPTPLPPPGTGTPFPVRNVNYTGETQTFSSTGTYTGTMSFSIQAVPLPPAVWLFGSGLLGLIGISRRKKA